MGRQRNENKYQKISVMTCIGAYVGLESAHDSCDREAVQNEEYNNNNDEKNALFYV